MSTLSLTLEKIFELAKKTDDFDEGWEKALYRICYLAPRYISRVKDISRLLSYLKDELLVKYVKEGEIKEIITRVISKTAVTNMCDSLKSDSQNFCLPRYSVLERDDSFKLDIKLSGWNAFWKYQL